MATNSSIEWTEATWNPVTGCTRASRGCDNCYAVFMTRRLALMGQEKYQGLINPGKQHFNGVVKCHEEALDIPLRRGKPTIYFVNSMSDLFHQGVPTEFIQSVFTVMGQSTHHTFQILTKRPERMAEVVPTLLLPDGRAFKDAPLPNVWLGTSVEDQEATDERIPHLLATPARVRFLSCEPLLGPLDLTKYFNPLTADGAFIHWAIVGGESGWNAREMKPEWVKSIRAQCEAAGVDFFFKQWGGVNKKKNGRELDGRTYDAMPERASIPAA